MEEYEKDHQLDKLNLDFEVAHQAGLYMKWSKRAAIATKERIIKEEKLKLVKDAVKKNLEEVRAKVDSSIRLKPEEYGYDKKPTEGAIFGIVIQSKEYKEEYDNGVRKIDTAVREYAEAVENEKVLEGATTGMNHKRSSLENMVKLWLGGYYADPKVGSEAKKVIEDLDRGAQKEGLNKNPRLKKRLGKE